MAAAATAAPSAQRAGPVALVNPVQVALDGFSEDVNQDGFVDPIAPAAIAAPIAAPWGYGLGAPWGYGKREAEAEPYFGYGGYRGGYGGYRSYGGYRGGYYGKREAEAEPYYGYGGYGGYRLGGYGGYGGYRYGYGK